MIGVTRLGGRGSVCRVLRGQRYPEVDRQQGIARVVECIEQVLSTIRFGSYGNGMTKSWSLIDQ